MNEDNAEHKTSNLSDLKSVLPDLETLKERLEHQEAAKLKAEQIASTLTRIKAREKASRRRLAVSDDVTNTPLERKSTSNNAIKEKSNLLKRKLEEDRARLESQKCSGNLNKVTEVVETIKARLEDRDKLMHQLFLDAQQQQQDLSSADESVSYLNETLLEPELPVEVKQKIADLEAKIIDLQENLKEKDNVISARTQAITLLSEDLSKKSKATLDTLEETQLQMRQMQNNFISIEDKMKKENQRLKEDAEDRKQKCLLAEKNLRIVEAARFDLSTRVAELQEKVVSLQSKNIDLEQSVTESEAQQKNFNESLEAAKNANLKMKAKFKIKLKALEEERDCMKKMTEEGSATSSLQERIAELEEEKGNLQLSLVDFDEQQEQCHLLKARTAELEDKLSQKEDDLDSHVKAISKLEVEKLDLIQVVQEHSSLLSEKDLRIRQLEQQLSDVERLKVSAEMRAIELEERLDTAIKENSNLYVDNQTDLSHMKQQLLVQEQTIKELQSKLLSRQNEISLGGGDGIDVLNLNSELEEWKRKYFDVESRLKNLNAVYKQTESRLEKVEKQNEQVVIECAEFRNAVMRLQEIVDSSSSVEKSDEVCIKRLLPVDESTLSSRAQSDERDSEVNKLRDELAAATVEMHRLYAVLDGVNVTRQEIDRLNMQLTEKEKSLTDVGNELEKRTRKLSDYKKFHKLKSEDVIRVSHELETITLSSQQKISELEEQLSLAYDKETELNKEIQELKDSVKTVPSELTQKMKKLAANLKLKAKACKEFEDKIESYKKSLEEKDNIIEEFVAKERALSESMKVECSPSSTLDGTNQQEQMMQNIETLVAERDDLNSKVIEQQQLINRLENELVCVQEERDNTVSQIEKIQENSFSKNDEILKLLQAQVTESKMEVESLQDQLSDVVSKYEQAWAKLQEKEAYIESIEAELNKARERLLSIERSTDEMQRTFREKAESLGHRLQQTEQTNAQFELCKNDLQMKLSTLTEQESLLQKSLSDKVSENDELKQMVTELSSRIEHLEREANDMRNYITSLQNQVVCLNDIQGSYNQSLIEIEKLNNEIKLLKSTSEKTVTGLQDRERLIIENTEVELKNLNEKCAVLEYERNTVSRELEVLQGEHHSLNDEFIKQKSDFEMRYAFLENERSHFEELYVKLKQETLSNEEQLNKISEAKSKEIERIMADQSRLIETFHADFEQKEQSYSEKIKEQEDYNVQLQEGLRTIETHAESLKMELNKVGLELNSCKEELVALKADQEKSLRLKNELEMIKDDYSRLLKVEEGRSKALEVELLHEKARKEVESVVSEAVIKVDSMSQNQLKPDSQIEHHLIPAQSNNDKQFSEETENSDELKCRLNEALVENRRLKTAITMYENDRKSNEVKTDVESSDLVESKGDQDGWGWGTEEPILEQEPGLDSVIIKENSKELGETNTELLRIEQRLKEAEAKNIKLTEELKVSQIRCSKLVKKAKELKAKSEDLEKGSREKSIGFEDLDFAMQEELRGQIKMLEKNLQEVTNENKIWKAEKENYLRKIDTLVSGNERLVDMKERQDIEMAMFQKQNSELKQQILAFEWKVEELMEDHEKLTNNCLEMETKINSLATENDNLIKVVGEMKDSQKEIDFTGSRNQSQDQEPNTMLRDISKNYNEIKEHYESLLKQHDRLGNEKNEIAILNASLEEQLKSTKCRVSELESEKEELKIRFESVFNIGTSYYEMTVLNSQLKEKNQVLQGTIKSNELCLTELENTNRTLEESLQVSNITDVEQSSPAMSTLDDVTCENDKWKQHHQKNEEDVKDKIGDPPSCSALFGSFTDASDPFKALEEIRLQEDEDSNSEKQGDMSELTEQVCTLTSLLEEKETELEISKQFADNIKLRGENLQDVWSQQFENFKSESTCTNDNKTERYETLLIIMEQKFKSDLMIKENLIGGLTQELSTTKQKMADLQTNLVALLNSEAELKTMIEQFKTECESQKSLITKLYKDLDELNALYESEKEKIKKSGESDLILSDLKFQYDTCLKAMQDESEPKLRLEKDYIECRRYLEERENEIVELNKQLDGANIMINELNHKITDRSDFSVADVEHKTESQIAETLPTVHTMVDISRNDPSIDEIIIRYKDMIKQRDIEIERLMEALGEAEEKVIKAEEMRLNDEQVNGLKLRLDEALYTLHLRDVRCEELTLELMQLLEERDTLQLRLSTAIRLNEDLRRKTSPFDIANKEITSKHDLKSVQYVDDEKLRISSDQQTTHSDSESRVKLDEKLDELHNIGYKKDLSVHQDRLKRHNEQMHLYSSSSHPRSQSSSSLQSTNEELNTSGGFFSWIFGSASSSNTQMDV